MDNNIEGKVVVITGASSGLGEATARRQSRSCRARRMPDRRARPVSQPEDVDVNEIMFRPPPQ
jgi:NAD(P)-dependent dehydrogenase (short-subunit alcohol dehydrogenase family)